MNEFRLLILLVLLQYYVYSQDLTIKGFLNLHSIPIDQKEIGKVTGNCYDGSGLVTCKAHFADDDTTLKDELPYYLTIGETAGAVYCLQCCSTVPSNIDLWDMYCPVTSSSINQVNYFGYEGRFARSRTATDTTIITCPLKRKNCRYDDNGKVIGECNQDNTVLTGYTLTLNVVQYNVNFKYWRGVESCEFETYETNATDASTGNTTLPFRNFKETIIMRHIPPTIPSWDFSKISLFSLFFIFVVYGALYFCRKKHCEFCGNKLVLSFHLCYKCRWVGAKRPDPVLLQALEEKAQMLQGKEPGFPGTKLIAGLCRLLFVTLFCSCKRKVKVAPSKYDLALLELESNIEMMESKIQALEEEDQSVAKKKKKYKNNPNILEYEPQIIYEAVQHPKFIK
jgi:hypothetical protein